TLETDAGGTVAVTGAFGPCGAFSCNLRMRSFAAATNSPLGWSFRNAFHDSTVLSDSAMWKAENSASEVTPSTRASLPGTGMSVKITAAITMTAAVANPTAIQGASLRTAVTILFVGGSSTSAASSSSTD